MDESDLRFFDRDEEFEIVHKSLPHWLQAGTVCFMTWRIRDSLPAEAVKSIREERTIALRSMGIDPAGDWKKEVRQLPPGERWKARKLLFELWDKRLDGGYGQCVLRDNTLALMVAKSLLHFDGDRYIVTDYVVMPNHVHLLVGFARLEYFAAQPTSWKRYTARQIGERITIDEEFWQVEQFDHLVRSAEQFQYWREYIRMNPELAGLPAGSCPWYSRQLSRPIS